MPDEFALEDLTVAVEESADELCYTLYPRSHGSRPLFPTALIVLLVGLPVAVAGAVGYALYRVEGSRPDWELALAGLFILQLLALPAFALSGVLGLFLRERVRHGRGLQLVFTRERFLHRIPGAGGSICDLAAVRGVRVFIYTEEPQLLADVPLPRAENPPDPKLPPVPPELAPIRPEDRPRQIRAALSLVLGDEGRTYGIFGDFDPAAMRTLADDLCRRLTRFRAEQGLTPAEPVEIVETTAREALILANTFPPLRAQIPGTVRRAIWAVFGNRALCTAWCAAGFAGAVGAGRVFLAAGLGSLIVALVPVVLLYLALLAAVWQSSRKPESENPEA